MIKKLTSFLNKKRKDRDIKKHAPFLAAELKKVLSYSSSDSIPVILISYNNGVYVKNSCEQLEALNCKPIIIDNASTDASTQHVLSEMQETNLAHVIKSKANFGHMVGFIEEVYEVLPEIFAYSDPDLQFNPNLPPNFLETLSDLTNEYNVYKAGFALPTDIGEPLIDNEVTVHRVFPFDFLEKRTIDAWESVFWRFKLQHASLDIYAATIDTTFAVYRKSNFSGNFEDAVRVAGCYSALHLPWFVNLDLFDQKNRERYKSGNVSSTWV